ncbi:hypothetical protein IMY05_017G0092000 [Salix suchowensis]|nr:hypothetical protein IMY05_017G0092000 [Salix suchowensis]
MLEGRKLNLGIWMLKPQVNAVCSLYPKNCISCPRSSHFHRRDLVSSRLCVPIERERFSSKECDGPFGWLPRISSIVYRHQEPICTIDMKAFSSAEI